MKEIKATRKNIKKFIKNLRKEDYEELKYFLKKKISKKFQKELENLSDFYFLSDKNHPIALGGVQQDKKHKNIGKAWLLCTDISKHSKIKLYKFIKEKILDYQKQYDIIYNFIFKSNFKAQKWLEKFGFIFLNTQNPDFKLFYYSNGEQKIDIRNIAN